MRDQELIEKTEHLIKNWIVSQYPIGKETFLDLATQIHSLIKEWLKEAGYVKLADDQSVPEIPLIDSRGFWTWSSRQCKEYQQDMLLGGWRKVEVE